MLRAALLTAMQFDIRTVIFAGDTIATDQEALNDWLKAYLQDEVNFPKALALEKTLLTVYKSWFTDGVYVISGNHDDRVARKTGGQVVMSMLLDSVGVDVSIYTYMYMFMPSVKEWVYIAHPYNYSKNSQDLARKIYNVTTAPDGYDNFTGEPIQDYDELRDGPNTAKCHVVVGHTHLQQEGWSEDGLYRCVALGTMRNPKKTAYMRRHATKFPKWNGRTRCLLTP